MADLNEASLLHSAGGWALPAAGINSRRDYGFKMIWAAAFLVTAPLVAFAHHSLFAEFDPKVESEYRATVVALDWANPHSSFQAKVAQQRGEVAWKFELPGPSGLVRMGWARDSVQTGNVVTIRAFPAKDGTARASVRFVVLGDGRTLAVDHPFNYQH